MSEPRPTDGPAPVAVFAYKRLAHLRQTMESLAANAEAAATPLYVFCDAPRHAEDLRATQEVRDYVAGLTSFPSVRVTHRERNFGLARNIVEGVGQVLEAHDRVIVVEDDLLLSPHFLAYMNDGLETYADDAAVASIHGYCYPVAEPLPETYVLRGADC